MANIFIIRQITRPEAYDYSTPIKKIIKIPLPVWANVLESFKHD